MLVCESQPAPPVVQKLPKSQQGSPTAPQPPQEPAVHIGSPEVRLHVPPSATHSPRSQQPLPLHAPPSQQRCPGSPHGKHVSPVQTRVPLQVRFSQQRSSWLPHASHVETEHTLRVPVQLASLQHCCPLAPQEEQVPEMHPSPLSQAPPTQQGSLLPPHAVQLPAWHVKPVPQTSPAQHGSPSPPHDSQAAGPVHTCPSPHGSSVGLQIFAEGLRASQQPSWHTSPEQQG